jgi:LETM1 and EF-hand domain-containing protein 1
MLLGRSVTRPHLLLTSPNSARWRYEPISFRSHRFLTTPTTDATPKAASPDLPHLPPLPLRKQKVELRPAPVKTSPINQTTTSTVAAPSPADVEKDANGVGGPASEPGIVETAKIDYSEASRHGILAPPPADASKIGRLWHQAKEYFVCYHEPIAQYLDAQCRLPEILSQGSEVR